MKAKNNILHVISILLLVFISTVITLLNFKKGYFLIGGDVGSSQIFPEQAIMQSIFMWQDRFAPGSNFFGWGLPAVFPYLTFLSLLLKAGFSKFFIQKVYFFLLLSIAGSSAYYLVISISYFKNKSSQMIAGFSGAIFYMLNHYTMMMFSSANSNYSLNYVWTPLLLALFIKGLDRKKDITIHFIIGFISIMCWATTNLIQIGISILLLCAYLIYYILANKEFFRPIKAFVLIVGICVLFNVWWLIPYFRIVSVGLGAVESWNAERWLNWMSERSSILNLFRLDGYTGWIKDFPYGASFNEIPLFPVVGYLIPILAFGPLLFKKNRGNILFFSVITLTGIFFAKGIHPPLGKIYSLAFKYVPCFHIFRSPYDKFVPLIALGYAYLIGISVGEIYLFFCRKSRCLSIVNTLLIVGVISGYSWPFWNGNVIRTNIAAKPSFWVQIPKEYYDVSSWINSQPDDFKVLVLPPQAPGYTSYSWGYSGENIFRNLFKRPIFVDSGLIERIFIACAESDNGLLNLMRIYNIRYILVDKYLKTDICLEDILKNQKGLRMIKQWDCLSVYSIDEKYCLPHIFISDGFTNVYGNGEILTLCANIINIDWDPFYVLNEQNNEPAINKDFIYVWNNEIGKTDFYIPNGEVYVIQAGIGFPLSKKKIDESPAIKWDKDNVDKWIFKINNIKYSYSFYDDNFVINAYFDGDEKEDEFLQIKGDINVDIVKYPWVEIEYKVEDKSAQIVETVIGIDINGDSMPDGYIKGLYQKSSFDGFSVDKYYIYDKAKKLFPSANIYKAVTLEIYPHKIWGIDCSGDKKREYRFWLKHVSFCDYSKEEYLMAKNGDIIDSSTATFDEEIFDLDGVPHRFSTKYGYGRIKDRVFCDEIYLSKGNHTLNKIESMNFNVNWMIVEKRVDIYRRSTLSRVHYKKINPVRYEIDIKLPERSFGLVFSESFHPEWDAYIINDDKKIILGEHYMVNGYANGWWVDPKKIKNQKSSAAADKNNGSLKIIIKYKPQKLVWIGFIVSGISLGIIGFLSIFWRNKHG